VHVQTPSFSATVVGVWAQLQQVVENLLVNADEAGGEAEVQITVRFERRRHPEGLAPGSYVALIVEDTGPGIDPALLDGLFDPFRSTKGQGRGIGLAGAQAVVRSHDGRISAAHRPGGGARFEVLLPSAEM
jgi:signal transduction histidine kinase